MKESIRIKSEEFVLTHDMQCPHCYTLISGPRNMAAQSGEKTCPVCKKRFLLKVVK